MLRTNSRNVVQKANTFISHSSSDSLLGTASTISPNLIRGPLYGKKIAIKDNVCTADHPTTCASAILSGFCNPTDATVVRLLREAGAIISGKTNMDEFGMGSHSVQSAFGPVENVSSSGETFSAGGSSGGSAVAVASSQAWVSIGTDTGGSIRLPAAYTGVYGFKPSYGLLSRNGVVAYANSLDTVGIMATSTSRIGETFKVLSRHDPRDPTSLLQSTRKTMLQGAPRLEILNRPLRIGVPMEWNTKELDPRIRKAWAKMLIALRKRGMEVTPVSLPATKHALSAYYVLAPAEASSNLSRYDGVRYGDRMEGSDMADRTLYSHLRGSQFGDEVRRRILLGTYTLSSYAMDNYFIRAQKVRRLVQLDFNKAFQAGNVLFDEQVVNTEGIDVLLCPTAPNMAPKQAELKKISPIQSYITDVMTVPASLAGLPAISIPLVESQGPETNIGMQLIGQFGTDDLVLEVSQLIEDMGLSNALEKESIVPSTGE